jgi:hypothetical protein
MILSIYIFGISVQRLKTYLDNNQFIQAGY